MKPGGRSTWRGGVSPKYDEKKDAEILKVLRANNLSPDSDIDAMIAEAEQLQGKIDKVMEGIAEDEKRLKTLKDLIKEACVEKFRDGDKQVIIKGSRFDWVTAKSTSLKVDEAAMKKDGVLDKYKTKESVTYRLTPERKKGVKPLCTLTLFCLESLRLFSQKS